MATGLTASDLVLEDGTGVANANTYVLIATATAYANLQQTGARERWALAAEADRVAALITATKYVDMRFQYIGSISVEDPAQALQWPRGYADGQTMYDSRGLDISDTVPIQIEEATIEYACEALDPTTYLAVELDPDPTLQDESGAFVTLKREKLGALEQETRFSASRGIQITRRYVKADRILTQSGLVAGTGQVIRA